MKKKNPLRSIRDSAACEIQHGKKLDLFSSCYMLFLMGKIIEHVKRDGQISVLYDIEVSICGSSVAFSDPPRPIFKSAIDLLISGGYLHWMDVHQYPYKKRRDGVQWTLKEFAPLEGVTPV